MCFIKELNKSLNKICKSNKIYINTIKSLFILIFMIFTIFIIFNEITSHKAEDSLCNMMDTNTKVINVVKSKGYKKHVLKNNSKNYKRVRKHIRKYNSINYKIMSSKGKSYLDNHLSNKTEVNIMMESMRYGFRDALSICIIINVFLIIYAKFKYFNKYKFNFFQQIGPICSVQIISAISVYSIILNFVDNAPNEPNFIIDTIIFMIAVMCTTFVVYTASSLINTKDIVHLI